MNGRSLAAIIEELAEVDVYPDTFSAGRAFIGAHKSARPFLTQSLKQGFVWHYTSRETESFHGAYEQEFAEALGRELNEDPEIALWRTAVGMHLSTQTSQDGPWEVLRQAVIDGHPAAIDDDTILKLLEAERSPHSRWQPLVVRENSVGNWQRAAVLARLVWGDSSDSEITIDAANDTWLHIWSLAVATIWRHSVSQLPDEPTLAAMIRSDKWPGDKIHLVDTNLRARTESTGLRLTASVVERLLPSNEPLALLAWATRSLLLSIYSEPHSALEYLLQMLRFHLERSREDKNEPYPRKWPTDSRSVDLPDAGDSLQFAVRFLQHIEGCKLHRWGTEAESHRVRAVEAARRINDWLPALAPWVIRAFAEGNEETITEVIAAVATDATLDRLAEMVDRSAEESLQTSGCVADSILRRCGRFDTSTDPAELRELVGPFEPIRGQTWLNDYRIEHILYEAVRVAEGRFSQYYVHAHHEHEDYLLRDLLDEHVRPALGQAVREANRMVTRPADRWGLQWSKLQAAEERKIGADLALVVEISAPNRIELRRVALLQVKAMRRQRDRFSSARRIDRRQLKDIRTASDSSFYLLLTPHLVSAQQRVLRADTVHGILRATKKRETLSDAHAGPHAHSLAQFLVYDLLGAWQGTEQQDIIGWLEGREGVVPRYIVTIRLLWGEGAHIDIG